MTFARLSLLAIAGLALGACGTDATGPEAPAEIPGVRTRVLAPAGPARTMGSFYGSGARLSSDTTSLVEPTPASNGTFTASELQ